MASKSLYVGNLSYSITESTLRELFAAYEPTEARLIADKGFGFVDVPEDKAAEAIAAMNGRAGDGGGGGDRGGGGFGGGRRRW
jgi:cold-inducible RNA-binding protein